MAKEVVVTPTAAVNYENITDYLMVKWGISATNNFIDRFDQVLILLSESPGIFPFVDKAKQVQKCLLTKHNILYFTETADVVKILTIFDTRQDPQKLNTIF